MPKPPDRPLPPWSQRIRDRQLDEPLLTAAERRLRDRRTNKAGALQFEQVVGAGGKSVPVATDDLLLRDDDLTPARRDTLLGLGLTPEPVAGLDGRIQRITLPANLKGKLKQTHDSLREQDVPVSPSAVTPMGAGPSPTVVWKSLCTPEPVASPLLAAPEAATAAPRIAVIDTGVTNEQRADGWLRGLAHANGDNVDPLDVFPTVNGYLDLGAGHGSFVAGIVQRVAPSVQLEVWRALDSDGITDEVTVACAMVAAARGGADVLNLSLGTETLDDIEPIALAEALKIIKEIEDEEDREIVVVAAAGNSGTSDRIYPAAFETVVAVAALTSVGEPAIWSSRGEWVTCSAVGENVVSTYVQGKEDPFVRYGDPAPLDPPDEYGPNSWAAWFGTSFAAPQVAARIALLAQQNGLRVGAAKAELLGSATRIDADFGVAIV